MLDDRLSELFALPGVVDRVLRGGPRRAGRGRAEDHTRGVESVHQSVEALTLLAEAIGLGHEDVLEDHLRVEKGTLAHLAERLGEAEAFGAAPDNKGRDAAGAKRRVHGREDDVELGRSRIGDPGLAALQAVPPCCAHGSRLQGSGIGADVRLSHGDRGQWRRRPDER